VVEHANEALTFRHKRYVCEKKFNVCLKIQLELDSETKHVSYQFQMCIKADMDMRSSFFWDVMQR
jgi:hypothetical protein